MTLFRKLVRSALPMLKKMITLVYLWLLMTSMLLSARQEKTQQLLMPEVHMCIK